METHSCMLLTAENKNSTLYLLSKNINFLFVFRYFIENKYYCSVQILTYLNTKKIN